MQTGISDIMGSCVLFQANGIRASSRFTYARAIGFFSKVCRASKYNPIPYAPGWNVYRRF